MTIASEILRIQNAKSDIKASIENKGVLVPSETKIDSYSALIDEISAGGGSYESLIILQGVTDGLPQDTESDQLDEALEILEDI